MLFLFCISVLIRKKSGVLFVCLNYALLYLNSLDKTFFNAANPKTFKNVFYMKEWI